LLPSRLYLVVLVKSLWFAAVLSVLHGLARFDVRARAQSSRSPTNSSAPLGFLELRERCVRKSLYSRRALGLFAFLLL
jgi:hypothetical protein